MTSAPIWLAIRARLPTFLRVHQIEEECMADYRRICCQIAQMPAAHRARLSALDYSGPRADQIHAVASTCRIDQQRVTRLLPIPYPKARIWPANRTSGQRASAPALRLTNGNLSFA